jgi:alcohol dehydrogenase class IV
MAYDRDLAFIYRNYTRIIYAEGSLGELGVEVDRLGGSRALVVTDKGVAEAGLVEKVQTELGSRCVGVFDGCVQDSGLELINEAAEFAREKGTDVLVSVGGGSCMDTAKGMAILLNEGGKIQDYFGFQNLTRPQTPHLAIPTTPGTGSEVTYFFLAKDLEKNTKILFADDYIIPNTAILDPIMTQGLPPMLTATTGMDALTHAIEGMTTLQAEPLADGMGFHAIRLIMEYLPRCVENGDDLFARGMQLLASTAAGICFSNGQVGMVHATAHTVGGLYGVPHGMANSILLPHVIMYNLDESGDLYVPVAQAMGVYEKGMGGAEAGEAVANAIWDLTKRMGVPQRLRDVGVPEDGLEEAAEIVLSDAAIVYNPKMVYDPEQALEVYKKAW